MRNYLYPSIFLLLCFYSGSALSQHLLPFITTAESIPDTSKRQAAVDSFVQVLVDAGIPHIEGDTAFVIYQGRSQTVTIAGDFNGWDPGMHSLQRLDGTDLWYLHATFEMNARLDYKLVLDGVDWILDPINPHTRLGGFGANSELAMPGYIPPWEVEERPGTGQGTLEQISLTSTFTNETYEVYIYLPHQYSDQLLYPTAYFQDGTDYLDLGETETVLNNLIDSALVSPMIAVFIRPTNRNEEYALNKRSLYRLFIIEELVPYIEEHYNSIPRPEARAVIGDSFGGNISALIAFHHPEVFLNTGWHSGAFWPNDGEAFTLVTTIENPDIRVASVWGSYEGGLSDNMRLTALILQGQGYDIYKNELPEGHSWGLWRATTDDILHFFFPEDITEEIPVSILDLDGKSNLPEVYPNPATDKFFIHFENRLAGKVEVLLFDGSAKLIMRLGFNTTMSVLEVPVHRLRTGAYHYTIRTKTGDFNGTVLLKGAD